MVGASADGAAAADPTALVAALVRETAAVALLGPAVTQVAAHPAAAAYSMGLPHVGYPAPHQMHEQPPGGGIDMKPIV